MCRQQGTATNKLCYVEARHASAQLRHLSWRNQVRRILPRIQSERVQLVLHAKLNENSSLPFLLSLSLSVCSVKTDMLTAGAISRLYIANANRHDSGNYTCGKLFQSNFFTAPQKERIKLFLSRLHFIALADIAQSTVMVHVLIGKRMKRKSGSPNSLLFLFDFVINFCRRESGADADVRRHTIELSAAPCSLHHAINIHFYCTDAVTNRSLVISQFSDHSVAISPQRVNE
jgi:hypothetical protein